MGIMRGGTLDQKCPNVREHGKSFHQLSSKGFMRQIQQIFRHDLDYCEEMNIHGARGALFKVKLPGYGYTVVAKATGVECVQDLKHESAIYQRLLPIQGKYVPVHLGEIDVDTSLYYAGAIRIVYMMFLSFGGFPLRSPISSTIVNEAIHGLQAMHQLGVLQKDPAARNILFHPDRPGITWIDFERATFLPPRVTLGSLCSNRKRKIEPQIGDKYPEKTSKAYAQEVIRARIQLATLVNNSSSYKR
jgi:serine/threonine protein kinase